MSDERMSGNHGMSSTGPDTSLQTFWPKIDYTQGRISPNTSPSNTPVTVGGGAGAGAGSAGAGSAGAGSAVAGYANISHNVGVPSGFMSSLARNNPGGIASVEKPICRPLDQVTRKRSTDVEWEGLIDQEAPVAHHTQQEVGATANGGFAGTAAAATGTEAQPTNSREGRARVSIAAKGLRLLAEQADGRSAFDQSPLQAQLSTGQCWAEPGDALDNSLWRGDLDQEDDGLSASMGSTGMMMSSRSNVGSFSARRTDEQEARRRRLRELRMTQGVERKSAGSRQQGVSFLDQQSTLSNSGAKVVSPDKLGGSLSHYDANKKINMFERQVCAGNTGTYRAKEWGAGGGGRPEPLGDRLHAGNYAVSSEAPKWMTQIREEHKPETLMHHKNARVCFFWEKGGLVVFSFMCTFTQLTCSILLLFYKRTHARSRTRTRTHAHAHTHAHKHTHSAPIRCAGVPSQKRWVCGHRGCATDQSECQQRQPAVDGATPHRKQSGERGQPTCQNARVSHAPGRRR
jgi:hypothetical protein